MIRNTAASPRASFQWRASTKDPKEIEFLSTSFGPDGSPADTLRHRWSFGGDGDGEGSTKETHRFPETGTHAVTLAVTTRAGVVSSATQNVTTRCAGGTNRPTADIAAEHRVLEDGTTEWTFTPGIFTTDARGVSWQSSTQLDYQWKTPDGQEGREAKFVVAVAAEDGRDAVTPTLALSDTRFGTTTEVSETFAPEEPPPEPMVTIETDDERNTIRVAYEPTRGVEYSEIEVFFGDQRAVAWTPTPPDIALGSPLEETVEVEAKEGTDAAAAEATTRFKSLRGTAGEARPKKRKRKED